MNDKIHHYPTTLFGWFFHYLHPWIILAGAGFYSLGASVIIFLGPGLNWDFFFLGLISIVFLLLSSMMLKAHFDQIDIYVRSKPVSESDPEIAGLIRLPRQIFLFLGLLCLTAGAFVTALLVNQNGLSLNTYIILGFAFFLSLFYGVPPFRLAYSGLGEFSQAILLAILIPAFAYSIQVGEINRFLTMLTLPLVPLLLALFLAQSYESYGKSYYLQHGNLVNRIGWQYGSFWHNVLLLVAYLLIGVAAIAGQPWSITWPALLSMFIALFQVYQMVRITSGAKPRWRLLQVTSFATVATTLYLLIIALITG
jgi:1,4-dihydroxy-2-naphthoate octaprenyltransferase